MSGLTSRQQHTPCERDPELWYSDEKPDRASAAILCMTKCPIREACLERAVVNGEKFGVWGGADFKPRHGPILGVVLPKRCMRCRAWMVPAGRIDKFRARKYCNRSCANRASNAARREAKKAS